MFTLENISKSYAKSNVKAVDTLNLSINDGEIFGFLGPNGAGKTTTIKLLTGILKADEGNISVNGIDISEKMLEIAKEENSDSKDLSLSLAVIL